MVSCKEEILSEEESENCSFTRQYQSPSINRQPKPDSRNPIPDNRNPIPDMQAFLIQGAATTELDRANELLNTGWKIAEAVRVGNPETEDGALMLILKEGTERSRRAILVRSGGGDNNGIAAVNEALSQGWNERESTFAVNRTCTLVVLMKEPDRQVGFSPTKWG